MGKKILILNGSPRPRGNSQRLAEAFAEGAQQAGHSVTTLHLRQMHIHPCIGCLKGGRDTTHPCTQTDDMNAVYGPYQEADILVLASPLYYWNFSGQLKVAIDRLYAVTEIYGGGGDDSPYKETVLLVAAATNTAENFAPMKAYYEGMLERLGWKDLGQLLVGGVDKVGDIDGHPALEEARRLGASLA